MDEVTIVLNSEQLDVWAPPAQIQVVVGVGAQGARGSKILAGNPIPSVFFSSYGETPLINDVYISVENQQAWQYVSTPTGPEWVLLFNIAELAGA